GRAGYAVILAGDGREALAEVERRGADIDLVVLDHSMPNLSGPETLAAIRARRPDAKVILTSGYAQWTGSPESGALETAFLSKPYSPATLLQAVRAALDEA
ncbi:MAG: response regulator, partial [Candidatus Methylomirabilis sp.]|nr:response regulator [Deltaproteobacteria bacterium]